jgi:hypothetical protein
MRAKIYLLSKSKWRVDPLLLRSGKMAHGQQKLPFSYPEGRRSLDPTGSKESLGDGKRENQR